MQQYPVYYYCKRKKEGTSCHQCKLKKQHTELVYCTHHKMSKPNGSMHRCQKKFCLTCISSYQSSLPSPYSWRCFYCQTRCLCASCSRKKKISSSPKKSQKPDDINIKANTTEKPKKNTSQYHDVNYVKPSYSMQYPKHTHTTFATPIFSTPYSSHYAPQQYPPQINMTSYNDPSFQAYQHPQFPNPLHYYPNTNNYSSSISSHHFSLPTVKNTDKCKTCSQELEPSSNGISSSTNTGDQDRCTKDRVSSSKLHLNSKKSNRTRIRNSILKSKNRNEKKTTLETHKSLNTKIHTSHTSTKKSYTTISSKIHPLIAGAINTLVNMNSLKNTTENTTITSNNTSKKKEDDNNTQTQIFKKETETVYKEKEKKTLIKSIPSKSKKSNSKKSKTSARGALPSSNVVNNNVYLTSYPYKQNPYFGYYYQTPVHTQLHSPVHTPVHTQLHSPVHTPIQTPVFMNGYPQYYYTQ